MGFIEKTLRGLLFGAVSIAGCLGAGERVAPTESLEIYYERLHQEKFLKQKEMNQRNQELIRLLDEEKRVYASSRYYPSGRQASGDTYIYITDSDDEPKIQLTVFSSKNPILSPDKTKILFTAKESMSHKIKKEDTKRLDFENLYVMNIDGSNIINLTKPITDEPPSESIHYSVFNPNSPASHWFPHYEDPSWSPNSKKITFYLNWIEYQDHDGIYVVDYDGKNLKRLVKRECELFEGYNSKLCDFFASPVFSPNGNTIAYRAHTKAGSSSKYPRDIINEIDLNGCPIRTIFDVYIDSSYYDSRNECVGWYAADFIRSLKWSPDGEKILFTAMYYKAGEWGGDTSEPLLFVKNIKTGRLVYLIGGPNDTADKPKDVDLGDYDNSLRNPTWSPDGKETVGYSNRTGDADIFLIDADGAYLKNLTSHPAEDKNPSWSADGKSILFYSDREGRGNRYRINRDGTALERLTKN